MEKRMMMMMVMMERGIVMGRERDGEGRRSCDG
jgi:hypothetical protein